MSKELTEKWKNGGLEDCLYYFKLPRKKIIITSKWGIMDFYWKETEDKIEVLAPVPSYDEYKNMADEMDKLSDLLTRANKNWTKTIKENKKLKEQLREANNIIVKADWDCDYGLQKKCGFSEYLKKYNIEGIK